MAAALTDDVGPLDHAQLMTLVAARVAAGRVLTLIERRRAAGSRQQGRCVPTPQGTPPGGVGTPVRRHRLLTPCDRERRRRGDPLTRSADDGVITCRRRREADAARRWAATILAPLGVRVNPQTTRMVHVRHGFAGLGDTITRGRHRRSRLAAPITAGVRRGDRDADPTPTSVDRCTAALRRKTRRRLPLRTAARLRELKAVIRGGGRRRHARSRAEPLPPTGPLGGATAVVTPPHAMALCGVANLPDAASPG